MGRAGGRNVGLKARSAGGGSFFLCTAGIRFSSDTTCSTAWVLALRAAARLLIAVARLAEILRRGGGAVGLEGGGVACQGGDPGSSSACIALIQIANVYGMCNCAECCASFLYAFAEPRL